MSPASPLVTPPAAPPELPDLVVWAIPAFVVLILVELIGVRMGWLRGRYERRDMGASLLMGLGNVVSGTLFGFVGLGALFLRGSTASSTPALPGGCGFCASSAKISLIIGAIAWGMSGGGSGHPMSCTIPRSIIICRPPCDRPGRGHSRSASFS